MQERGCWALRQIAVGGAAPQAIVLEAGGAAAVIAAMTKHADAAAVVQHGQSAVAQLGSCASSGRAWRLWAVRHSQGEADPLGAQPLGAQPPCARASRLQSLAEFTAFDF